jgi:glycosyltransferase involved in cell wall biosynthesis
MSRLEKEIAVKPEWSAYRKLLQWLGIDKGGVGRFSVLMNKSQFQFKQMVIDRDKGIPRDPSKLRSGGVQNLVSIILPVFNGEKYLHQAIISILGQNYAHWELVVVDDGSTDGTREIVKELQSRDKRIQYHYQENAKLPAALNKGHELSTGEFITWTSDDNILKPDFLEVLVAEISNRPDVSMFYGNFQIIGEDGDVLIDHAYCAADQYPPGSGNVYSTPDVTALQNYIFIGGAFLYRRVAYLLLGGYSENRFTCEDYDFFLRMNSQFKIRHTMHLDPIYEYRLHGDSLSTQTDAYDIPRRTKELQVFDDGRWDLLSGPTAWHLQGDGSAKTDQCIAKWRKYIQRTGDYLIADDSTFPEWQTPIGSLSFVDSADTIPEFAQGRNGAEAHILIYLGEEDVKNKIHESWDGLLKIGDTNETNKNWIVAKDMYSAWHACRTRAWAKFCEDNEVRSDEETSADYDVSAVVCTNRSPELLEAVVDSFPEKNETKIETILVNNDPGRYDYAPVQSLLIGKGYNATDVQLINCYPMGLSFARNAGLRAARGSVVVYLDDDVAVDANLFTSIDKTFEEHDGLGALGGAIELRHPDPAPWWYDKTMAAYWSAFKPKKSQFYHCDNWMDFPYGANWSGRNDALVRAGGFRNRYGRGSGFADSGEEIVAALSIQKIGYTVGVQPEAKVLHLVEADRFQLNQLKRIIITGYDTALCMSTEQRIQPLLGLKGSILRVGYRLLLVFTPKPIGLGHRIKNAYMSLSYFRYFCKLLSQSVRRLGKHPVLFD